MSLTLLFSPDLHSFTQGGRLYYDFAGDGPIQTPGIAAINSLLVKGPVPDGTTVTIRWNGRTEVLTARDTPTEPNEFPAGDGSEAYVSELAEWFGNSYAFKEDFTLSYSQGLGLFGVDFYAKRVGPQYNFIEIAGAILHPAPATIGVAPKRRDRYAVYVELWTAKAGAVVPTTGLTENESERIYQGYIETDEAGKARFDAGSVLHAHLTPDWPAPGSVIAEDSARAYFILFGESYGTPAQVGQLTTSLTRYALLGGASHPKKGGAGFSTAGFVGIQKSGDTALRFGSLTRYVRADEPQYLTFLNQRAEVAAIGLKVLVVFTDNSTQALDTLVPKRIYRAGGKLQFAVGFAQLNIAGVNPAKTVTEYQVQLATSAGSDVSVEYSKTYRYILNYDFQPYTKYFVYLNSLGCWDTLATFGKGSTEWSRFAEQAERVLPIGYDAREGQFIEYDVALQLQGEVTTGYRSQNELRYWADFYRSPSKFMLTRGRLEPIGLLSKSIQQAKDGDTLFAHKFEYVRLYQDEFYSEEPDDFAPGPPANFTPAGSVAVTVNTAPVVNAVDTTVPDVVRAIDIATVMKWTQAFGWGDHRQAGYLNAQGAVDLFPTKASVYTKAQADARYAKPGDVSLNSITGGNSSTTNTARVGTVEVSAIQEAEAGADEVIVTKELADGRKEFVTLPANLLPRSFLIGEGAPSAELGAVNNLYLDVIDRVLYGPKTDEGWGEGVRLDKNRLHLGNGAPAPELGNVGDSYIDRSTGKIHENFVTGWDAGTPFGSGGSSGSAGILHGETVPDAEVGEDKSFYFLLDSAGTAYRIYGPKIDGNWGPGRNLDGRDNATTGATGVLQNWTARLRELLRLPGGITAPPVAGGSSPWDTLQQLSPLKIKFDSVNNPTQKRCYRIAVLPPQTNVDNYAHVAFQAVLGGYAANHKEELSGWFANRDVDRYVHRRSNPNPNGVSLVARKLKATGQVIFYLRFGIAYGSADVRVSVLQEYHDVTYLAFDEEELLTTSDVVFDSDKTEVYIPEILVQNSVVQVPSLAIRNQPALADEAAEVLAWQKGSLVRLTDNLLRKRVSVLKGLYYYDTAITGEEYRPPRHRKIGVMSGENDPANFEKLFIAIEGGGLFKRESTRFEFRITTRGGLDPMWETWGLKPEENDMAIVIYKETDGRFAIYQLFRTDDYVAYHYEARTNTAYLDYDNTPVLSPSGTLVFTTARPADYPSIWHHDPSISITQNDLTVAKKVKAKDLQLVNLPPAGSNFLLPVYNPDLQRFEGATRAQYLAFLGLEPTEPPTDNQAPKWPAVDGQLLSLNSAFSILIGKPTFFGGNGGTIEKTRLAPGTDYDIAKGEFYGTAIQAGNYGIILTAIDGVSGKSSTLTFAANVETVADQPLKLIKPTYDPATGIVHANVQNAKPGKVVEYMVSGLKGWQESPDFTVPTWQRDGREFTMEARYKVDQSEHTTIGFSTSEQTVNNDPPTVTENIPNQIAFIGVDFKYQIRATVFTDPNRDGLKLTQVGLPEGLSMSESGLITGKAKKAGQNIKVSVQARDPSGAGAETEFYFYVAEQSNVVQIAPDWDAATGNLTIKWKDEIVGRAVQSRIPAISEDWNRPNNNPVFFIPNNLRTGKLILEVRQKNDDDTYKTSRGTWTWGEKNRILSVEYSNVTGTPNALVNRDLLLWVRLAREGVLEIKKELLNNGTWVLDGNWAVATPEGTGVNEQAWTRMYRYLDRPREHSIRVSLRIQGQTDEQVLFLGPINANTSPRGTYPITPAPAGTDANTFALDTTTDGGNTEPTEGTDIIETGTTNA